MYRDIEPDGRDIEQPDLSRGGGAGDSPERADSIDLDRDALTRDLDLPRGSSRESVRRRNWEGDLRGSEVRVMATAGAFRVVAMDELRRPEERPHVHRKDVQRLRELELISTMPYVVGKERETLVTLTERGRDVLEASRREPSREHRQTFYAGIAKPRELAHDVRVHSAYLEASRRLEERGLRVCRVVLEQELKREYQRFLQEPNRGRRSSSGRVQRTSDEIARWAREHELRVIDDHVQFPDLRLECEGRDGRREIEDVEVMTPHYRGAHARAKVQAGFTRYGSVGARLGGSSRVRRGGRAADPRLAEQMLR